MYFKSNVWDIYQQWHLIRNFFVMTLICVDGSCIKRVNLSVWNGNYERKNSDSCSWNDMYSEITQSHKYMFYNFCEKRTFSYISFRTDAIVYNSIVYFGKNKLCIIRKPIPQINYIHTYREVGKNKPDKNWLEYDICCEKIS